MLDYFRRGAKSWLAKGLIVLLIASFAVWGIGDIFTFRLDSTVASVGDTEIKAEEYADALQRRRAQLSRDGQRAVTWAEIRQTGEDQRVLASLIRDAAIREEMTRRGIAVPDNAVAEAIRTNPAFDDGLGRFSQAAYEMRLAQTGFDPIQFERAMRTLLGQDIIGSPAREASSLPPGLVPRIAAFQGETRSVQMMFLEPGLAEAPPEPTADELSAYFGLNAERYAEPERRSGVLIHIDPARIGEGIEVTEARVREIFDANIDRFTVEPARSFSQLLFADAAEAEAAAERVRSGEITWERLAEEVEQIPEPIDGAVATDLPPATAEAVFATEEPGIVGPVRLPVRHALINLTGITAGGAPVFEDVREALEAEIRMREARLEVTAQVTRLEDLRAMGQGMTEIASEFASEPVMFEGIARDGLLPNRAPAEGILANAEVRTEIFTALDGEEREVIELDDGSYAVVSVETIEAAHPVELDDVRARVIADWTRERRLEELEEKAEGFAAAIAAGETDFLAAADEIGATTGRTPPFSRLRLPPAFAGALADQIFGAEIGAVITGRAEDESMVLALQVIEIQPMEPAFLEQLSEGMVEQREELLANDMSHFFARAVENRYEPEIADGAIDEVFRLLGGNVHGGYGG